MEVDVLLHLGSVEIQPGLVLVHLLRLDLSFALHRPHRWKQGFSFWDFLQWDDLKRSVSQVISEFNLGGLQKFFCVGLLHSLVEIHCVRIG